MPHFISKGGVWEPATERVVDPNAPEGQEVYQGPDRGAQQMIEENGGTLGQHFTTDPEMIMRARQLGFNTVDEYLKMYGYDKEKAEAAYQKHKATIQRHQNPERKVVPQIEGGGKDVSGSGRDRFGGFEHPTDAPASMTKPAEVPSGRPAATK